jgi:hypothetical protein
MQDGSGLRLPALPAGYTAAAAWAFHDAGGLVYEFFRVYGASEGTGDRGAFVGLDEDLSYWAVSRAVPGAAADEDEHVLWRWLNYERARSLTGAGLEFQRFSSPLAMREELPRLFKVFAEATTGGSR